MGSVVGKGRRAPITVARRAAVVAAWLAIFSIGAPRDVAAQLVPDIAFGSSLPDLIVNSAVAGSNPVAVSDNSSRVSLTVESTTSLFASIDAPLPSGVVLRIRVAAPAGALSMGYITLSTTPQVVLRDIPSGIHPGLVVNYELIAVTQAGVIVPESRNVTLALQTE